jgi:hypothetical protein
MTNHTEMTTADFQMLMAQHAKHIAEVHEKIVTPLIKLVEDLKRRPTFAEVLESQIEEIAAEIGCFDSVWINPVTGNRATSVYLAFLALEFWHSRFHEVRAAAKRLDSHHERNGLKTTTRSWARGWPTPCIDIADVEVLLLSTAPIKGRLAVNSFKKMHGI